MSTPSISQRGLNRATLERQLLSRRHDVPAAGALEHLVGLQAQAPNPPYIGLWTRLERFDFAELTTPMKDRAVVRSAVMRGTLHLLTADDFVRVRALVQPVLERALQSDHGRLGEGHGRSFGRNRGVATETAEI